MASLKKPTESQQAHALISAYEKRFADKYNYKPIMNRFKYRWGFDSMIKDLGYTRAEDVIEFYFRTERIGHPVDYLLYNYEKLNEIKTASDLDDDERCKIRAATKLRVAEWEKLHGN